MSLRTPKPIIDFQLNAVGGNTALIANIHVAEAEDDFDTLIRMLEDVKDVASMSIEVLENIKNK